MDDFSLLMSELHAPSSTAGREKAKLSPRNQACEHDVGRDEMKLLENLEPQVRIMHGTELSQPRKTIRVKSWALEGDFGRGFH
jgi:hypothetical protein